MKVSLNLIKKYIDLPKELTPEQIARDLTIKTVEVEDVEDVAKKYENIVVGKILEINPHPNADKLRVCKVDIGEKEPVQIVCGGSNLYENEYVVVSKPGAKVVWHGEGEPVEIKAMPMRGVDSFGMICAAEEVFLDGYFKSESETEIVDLKGVNCKPGQSIAEVISADDVVIEIDNKSLTNRPDLWGHYGIARELSAIYNVPLKELPKYDLEKGLKKYDIEIANPEKCARYIGVEIDGIEQKDAPMWMQTALINAGMKPINAIVDITNYVMIVTGQPMHAFDRTHIDGQKIIVRNAKKDEKLELLDGNNIELGEDDLVICDIHSPLCLAGIRGGIKDSVLPETTGVLLEVANFEASTIRKSEKRFDEKTDAGIRYEKGIDTERVDQGVNLALTLVKEIFPNSKIIAYADEYKEKTERAKIDVTKEFLNVRLGIAIEQKEIERILAKLGFDVKFENGVYHVIAPVWRSTGDISLRDDVLGEIARIIGYDNFEPKPLPIKVEHAVIQNDVLLERRLREYLSFRCSFDEVITYPWIEDKYIEAAGLDKTKMVRLATPPSPDMAHLRSSLIPSMLDSIAKNLRYFDDFKIYELTQVYEKGEYHESTEDETLPIHKKMLAGAIVGKNAREILYELKGVLEGISNYCHMEGLELEVGEKPAWADINAHMNILLNGEVIGCMGLLSIKTMLETKIKHTNVAMFELNVEKLVPYTSRTNEFKHLPGLPLIEKDLSILVDEKTTWEQIRSTIAPHVNEVIFVEEYRGGQVPEGKKSIMLKMKIENNETTMTSEEIGKLLDKIIKALFYKIGATLREE